MRVLTLAVALLVLPGLVWAADEAKGEKVSDKKDDEAAAPKVPPKPEVRTVQVKSSIFQFTVRLKPGVPDPGEVVEARIEMAEVPPVPDPIYGETIPVKGAALVAEVTDADGAGYTLAYKVHALTDAGAYGFHFTPTRKDTYRVVLKGEHKSQKVSPSLRVPVGIWPFKDVDESGKEKVVPATPGGSRLPALPGGAKRPALPGGSGSAGGPAAAGAKPADLASPLQQAMQAMGERWVALQVALFAGRRADLGKAKAAAAALGKACQEAVGASPKAGFDGLVREAAGAADKVAAAAGKGKPKPTVQAFDQLGARHCNRCHFAQRWQILASPEEFPAMLPE